MRQAVGANGCCIEGHATPFGVYRLLWRHRHRPVILDDADSLFQNPEGLRLLKALCQSEAIKQVSWQSDNRTLKEENIPREFQTTSKVAIVANQWCPRTADVAALEDRGHILVFQPSALEVHVRTANWFWCQEILDFFGERVGLITQPSMRHYLAAWELRQAGLDWKAYVLSRFLSGTALRVAQLKTNLAFATEEERAQAFVDAGDGCRATYFAHAKKLRPDVVAPAIVLANTEPPDEHAPNTAPPDEHAPNTEPPNEHAPNTDPPDEYAPNAEQEKDLLGSTGPLAEDFGAEDVTPTVTLPVASPEV
jgi:hypothetical protein